MNMCSEYDEADKDIKEVFLKTGIQFTREPDISTVLEHSLYTIERLGEGVFDLVRESSGMLLEKEVSIEELCKGLLEDLKSVQGNIVKVSDNLFIDFSEAMK